MPKLKGEPLKFSTVKWQKPAGKHLCIGTYLWNLMYKSQTIFGQFLELSKVIDMSCMNEGLSQFHDMSASPPTV